MARCGVCARWASVHEHEAFPVGTLITVSADGSTWMAQVLTRDDREPGVAALPEHAASCGNCGGPMIAVDQVVHRAALPTRQDDPTDVAMFARQKEREKK